VLDSVGYVTGRAKILCRSQGTSTCSAKGQQDVIGTESQAYVSGKAKIINKPPHGIV
jgi:hypothetical protein